MKTFAFLGLFLLVASSVALSAAIPDPTPLPAPGEWDGVTAKAKLDRSYEDPLQAYIPFGLSSYFLMPWRAYMDTQPASHFLGSMAFNLNSQPEHSDAVLQVMSEAGIRKVRYEVGWGNMQWSDQMDPRQPRSVHHFSAIVQQVPRAPDDSFERQPWATVPDSGCAGDVCRRCEERGSLV